MAKTDISEACYKLRSNKQPSLFKTAATDKQITHSHWKQMQSGGCQQRILHSKHLKPADLPVLQ